MSHLLKQALRYRVARVWLLGHKTLSKIRKPYSADSFRVLLFHDVAPEQMADFERLLRYLLREHGLITPEDAVDLLSGRLKPQDIGRVPYLLTFDDGFHSHSRIAREILDPNGVKGLFFVCPGLIDITGEQHRDTIARYIFDGAVSGSDLAEDMALMSWSDVESLSEKGHTIGSHGFTHRRLAGLDGKELEQEIIGAGIRLEERLGLPPDWFAYPFGDLASVDLSSLNAIASRYRFCCSGIRGINSVKVPPLAIFREQLGLESPYNYQQLVVEGGLDFYYGSKAKQLKALANNTSGRIITPDRPE